ncbi:hypothetical protein IAR55_005445 [Kwoniella newhampshirensis]|uniref:DUF6534 domain-containing protein n=1 Tax=Kwoniella newhampshirensis TaxID=1651941 RepID=A0AAW0YKV7_9TREE
MIAYPPEAAAILDAAIYNALHSDPTRITWWCCIGVALEGIVLGAILTQTYKYYEHFHLHDSRLTLWLVGVGMAACAGQFGLNLWQTYNFIDKASTAVYQVLEKDVYADMVILLFIGLFNFAAAVYFSRRALKLLGRVWALGIPLAVMSVASLAMCIACVCTGFSIPKDTNHLEQWLDNVNKYVIAWTAVSLATDIAVCGAMTYALLKSRDEIKAAATSLLRKLLMLTFETMMPPGVVVFVLLIFGSISNATMGNFSRVLVWTIGPLYFHAIIHSLVSRHDVQFILQHQGGHRSGSDNNRSSMSDPAPPPHSLGYGRHDTPMILRPVVIDERARKELGFMDDHEFGPSMV